MKLKKLRNNLYELEINYEKYKLYDDVIIKYNLLSDKPISDDLLSTILKDNDNYLVYDTAIKYISKKMRTEKELSKYLNSKFEHNIIDEQVDKIKRMGYLDENKYVKAYINDQVNMSNNGPIKIKTKLLELGILENNIDDYLSSIDSDTWLNKIEKYISKNSNSIKCSSFKFRGKLFNNLINLGYEKEMINDILSKHCFNDKDLLIKEYNKYLNKFSKKYDGDILNMMLFKKLSSLGFDYSDINNLIQ